MRRAGVLLDAPSLQRWQWRLLDKLQATTDIVPVVAIVGPADPTAAHRPPGERLYRRYAEYERKRFSLPVDPLAERPLAQCAPGLAVLQSRATATTGVDAEALSRLRDLDLDVLIRLAWHAPVDALVDSAARGIWEFAFGDPTPKRRLPDAFAETRAGRPVTRVTLRRRAVNGTAEIASAATATDPVSPNRTLARLRWLAAELLVREARRPTPAERPRAAEPAVAAVGAVDGPSVVQTARFVAGRLRAAYAQRRDTQRLKEHWELHVHLAPQLSLELSRFRVIPSPPDRYWADPHVLARDGRFYVFVEEFLHARGRARIAVLTVEPDGRVGEAVPVLERDWHLSYPFVFEHAGRTFMVPESGSTRSIELYECTAFPNRWEHVHTLMDDVYAVDTTLLHRDGRWWLFSGICDHEGFNSHDELHLFSATDLFSSRWERHPESAVVLDARCSRPAGGLLEHEGRLLRPAQDCSQGYGYAVQLMDVTTLDERRYAERPFARLEPGFSPGVRGVHSLAHVPGLTVVDAKRYQRLR